MASSHLSAGLAVLAGLVTVLSPCVLPILPVLVGRSLQSHRYGPLALVIGLIAGFATIGSLLGVTVSWFAGLASVLRYVALALLLLVGINAIFPNSRYRLFSLLKEVEAVGTRLPRPFIRRAGGSSGKALSRLQFGWLKEPARVGLMGEYWLGTQLGLLWTPCAGPVLASILLLAAVKHNPATAFGLLIFYGLGAAFPLLLIAYGGRYLSQSLLKLRFYTTTIQRVGGAIIVITAIAILLGWDVQIQLWLALHGSSLFDSLEQYK
ncbi:MAG: cytochrome c biogenesis protein CcdA [Chroococcidiopsidaceae cyanobacterium CP_BM_ER_R8_30]|nr:cytochrome c biogenesis protein CcdA [Chroococcidiopsidaceae cyanobacterium CP_BM_ER_R8_30]